MPLLHIRSFIKPASIVSKLSLDPVLSLISTIYFTTVTAILIPERKQIGVHTAQIVSSSNTTFQKPSLNSFLVIAGTLQVPGGRTDGQIECIKEAFKLKYQRFKYLVARTLKGRAYL